MDNVTSWWLAQLLMRPVRDSVAREFGHLAGGISSNPGSTARLASQLIAGDIAATAGQSPQGRPKPFGTVYPNPFDGPLYIDDAVASHLRHHMMFNSTPMQRQKIYSDDRSMDPDPEMFDPRFSPSGGFVHGGATGLPPDRFIHERQGGRR